MPFDCFLGLFFTNHVDAFTQNGFHVKCSIPRVSGPFIFVSGTISFYSTAGSRIPFIWTFAGLTFLEICSKTSCKIVMICLLSPFDLLSFQSVSRIFSIRQLATFCYGAVSLLICKYQKWFFSLEEFIILFYSKIHIFYKFCFV